MEEGSLNPSIDLKMEIKDGQTDPDDKNGLNVEVENNIGDAGIAVNTANTPNNDHGNGIPNEEVNQPETADTAYVLPDINLSSLEFDEFHSKETVDDSSSVTTGFSTTIMDSNNGLGYPLVGYPFRPQQRQFGFGGNQQDPFHPHYQAMDQVFPQPNQEFAYYPQEPQNVHQQNISYNQDQRHLQAQGYRYEQQQEEYHTHPKHFPSSPLSAGNSLYQQPQNSMQPLIQQPTPGFQPRQDSRFKDTNFNPMPQKRQFQPPTPRTSLQRQKQIEADDVGIPPVTRYCCGMFRTRKKCRMICIPILVLLMTTGILLIYFLYPRTPEISLNSALYQTGEVSLTGNFKRSSVQLTVPLFGNFTASSPNYIPYSAHISLTGSLINPNDKSPSRINGHVTTSIKSDKTVYTSPGSNSFQMLLTYTYTQSSATYTKNLLRQAKFKEVDGDLQALFLSCAPELIGVTPYPDRKPKMVTVRLEWKVDVLMSSHTGSLERDVECPEGTMRMLKTIADDLT